MKMVVIYVTDENGNNIMIYDDAIVATLPKNHKICKSITGATNQYMKMCKQTTSFEIENIGELGIRIKNLIDGVFLGGLALWFDNFN